MRIARELFGIKFGVSCRNDYPSVHSPPRKLLANDVINVVQVEGNTIPTSREFNATVTQPGADLIYDIDGQKLRLRVRYDFISAKSNYFSNLLKLGPQSMPQEELDELPQISVFTKFVLNGMLVKVVSVVHNSHVVVESTRNLGNQITLSYNEAIHLIIECNK
jgi:hypothetical protein